MPRFLPARNLFAILALALLGAACQDLSPVEPSTTLATSGPQADKIGKGFADQYSCRVTMITPVGIVQSNRTIMFPKETLSHDHAVQKIIFQTGNKHGMPKTALCTIPKTPDAVVFGREYMRAVFQGIDSPQEQAATSFSSLEAGVQTTSTGTVTTCYYSGQWYCVLDGVTNSWDPTSGCSTTQFDPACPDPYYYCQYDQYAYGCPGSPCYINNTMDICRDPCYVYGGCTVIPNTSSEGTADPTGWGGDRLRDGAYPCPFCVGDSPVYQAPDAADKQKYLDALEKIDKTKCLTLYNTAASFIDSFVVWPDPYFLDDPITGEKKLVLGHYQEHMLGDAQHPEIPERVEFYQVSLLWDSDYYVTVAHEAAHAMGKVDEVEAESYAQSCTS